MNCRKGIRAFRGAFPREAARAGRRERSRKAASPPFGLPSLTQSLYKSVASRNWTTVMARGRKPLGERAMTPAEPRATARSFAARSTSLPPTTCFWSPALTGSPDRRATCSTSLRRSPPRARASVPFATHGLTRGRPKGV